MNTATISPALDIVANKSVNAKASKAPEAGNDSPRFSDVLSHQHASQAPKAGKHVDDNAPSKNSGNISKAPPKAESLDTELSTLAGELGTGIQLLVLDPADPAMLQRASAHGDTRTLQEPGIAKADVRQALPPTDGKFDTDYALARADTSAAGSADSRAALAALMPAFATAHRPGQTHSDATSRHQTLTADGKAKALVTSTNGNPLLTADTTKAADPSARKIAVSEFSAAMIDAATLARARLTASNVPDNTITAASANDQLANLTNQILPSGPAINTTGTAAISTPLNSPQWGADFGRQFVTMLQNGNNGHQTAELRLDPPELGPIRITLNLADNIAHAAFFSSHAVVRQTLENALPQLQELLAQAGISLGDTSVNDQNQTAQDSNDSPGKGQSQSSGRSVDSSLLVAASDSNPAAHSRSPDALVDTFA